MPRLAIALLVLAAAAVGYFLRGLAPELPNDARHASTVDAKTTTGEPSQTSPQSAMHGPRSNAGAGLPARSTGPALSAIPVHPAAGTKVKDVLAALQDAADHGEPAAACRVGVELVRCYRTSQQAAGVRRMRAALAARTRARTGDDEDRKVQDLLDRDEIAWRDEAALCEGIPVEQARDGWRYLFQSAFAGNVAAMSKFVRDPGLSLREPAMAGEGWMMYAKHAPAFLDAAVAAGDVNALAYAAFAYSSGLSTGGEGVFTRNAEKALVYGTAVLPFLSGPRKDQTTNRVAKLSAELGPAAAARATSDGERLRQQSFADAKVPDWSNDDGAVDPADCAKR